MLQTKGKFFLIGSVSLLVGITAGAIASWYYTTRILSTTFAYTDVTETILDSQLQLATLVALQQGDAQKASESLENALDFDILDLGHNAWSKKDKSIFSILKQIRQYRSEHPWHSQIPGMDQQIARVLNTGDNQ